MRILIAFLLPWHPFFADGRPFAGIACLALQLTLLGWIPAAIWALYVVSRDVTRQRIRRIVTRTS